MKKILTIFAIIATMACMSVSAQAHRGRGEEWKEKMMAEKIAFLTLEVGLTPEAYPQHAFYQLLPRLGASSEVQWCNPDQKNFDYFKKRLPRLKKLYDLIGVNYCKQLE